LMQSLINFFFHSIQKKQGNEGEWKTAREKIISLLLTFLLQKKHPNVIQCIEFIKEAPAIVMEIASRGSLRDFLFELKNPIGKWREENLHFLLFKSREKHENWQEDFLLELPKQFLYWRWSGQCKSSMDYLIFIKLE